MRMFFVYLCDLCKETLFLLLFLLGIVSTAATFYPKVQNPSSLKWAGFTCIAFSFIGANFRLYKKNVGRTSRATVRTIIDELEANCKMLQTPEWSTSPALSDAAWKMGVHDKIPGISDDLRGKLNNCYIKITAAKGIHQSIQNLPLTPDGTPLNTLPEQIRIEKLLEEAKQGMPDVIEALKDHCQNG